jgi:membrane protease YdiL (CAAX protease family)
METCYDGGMASPASSIHNRADQAVIAVAIALPTLVTWLYFEAFAGSPAATKTAFGIGKTIQFALPLIWVLLVQRRPLRLPWPKLDGVLLGIAFGAMVGTAMLLLYYFVLGPRGFFEGPAAEVRQKVAQFGVTTVAGFAVMGLFYSLVHSLLEEYYWRWFVVGQLREQMPLWPAVAISSVAFTLHHVIVLVRYFGWASPATWLFVAGIVIGGAAWAWLYDRTKSLYGPWISHLLVDAAIFWIGYDLVRADL